MYQLTVVLNNEDLLGDLITGWMDIGIAGATVIESTGSLQLVSAHVPIFAGFRSLVSGAGTTNKTIFTVIEDKRVLDLAVSFLKELCDKTGRPSQGVYYVTPVSEFGRLGQSPSTSHRKTKKGKKTKKSGTRRR